MISKNELKIFASLLKKKFREKENKFLVEGKKIVLEGLNSRYDCELVIVTHLFNESNEEFLNKLQKYNLRIEVIKNPEFQKLADTQSPQGIAAVFNKQVQTGKKEIQLTSKLIVCLEGISEPGNVGTIIRNCDWFGISEILLDKNCADVYNPKTIRASMGSVFHVNIFENTDLFESLPLLKKKGFEILCTDIEGDNIYTIDKINKSIVILANEANGPSHQAISLADRILTIPRTGQAESLNVASASAVILSEITRRTQI